MTQNENGKTRLLMARTPILYTTHTLNMKINANKIKFSFRKKANATTTIT